MIMPLTKQPLFM